MPGRGITPIDEGIARFRYLIVRTTTDPAAMLPALRRTVHDLDPTLPFADVATVDDLVGRALDQPRSLSILVAAFALVALLLSVVGIYGVMAYYVQQHAKDIGIRVALGGRPRSVLGSDRRPGHDRRCRRRRDRPGRCGADRTRCCRRCCSASAPAM